MPRCLAYADNSDTSAANLQAVMICAGVILAAAAVAFVPVGLAWSKRHRQTSEITAAAILWGVLAAASVARATLARVDYSRDFARRIQTGYYDPTDQSDAPTPPLKTWGALGVAYGGLFVWCLARRTAPPTPPR